MKTVRVVAENYSVQSGDTVVDYGEEGREVSRRSLPKDPVAVPALTPERALIETLRGALAFYDLSRDRCTEPCKLCAAVDDLRKALKEADEE